LIDSSYIDKSYIELEREGFVIDERYPRCEGKGLRNPDEIAHFLAKVFHHNNTQLLIHDNKHARILGIDTNQHKMLINGSKGGIVERVARENFDKIVPSSEAVSYMLDLVNTFIEKEPKLEF
jgi:predicted chitinase